MEQVDQKRKSEWNAVVCHAHTLLWQFEAHTLKLKKEKSHLPYQSKTQKPQTDKKNFKK